MQRRYQGQLDSTLTENGKEQARIIAKKFKDTQFDAIFSSDLPRAHQTAEAIALEHKMIVKTYEILRERNYGGLEGKTMEESKKELQKLFDEYEELSHEKKFAFKFVPDMESDEEIATRMITCIREIAVAYSGKTVLMVAHGGIMRSFLVKVGFAPFSSLRKVWIENTGYVKLRSDGVDFFIDETSGISVES